MDVVCRGPNCGRTFQATNPRAKYCSSTCRSRGNRAGGSVVELPTQEPTNDSGLLAATRSELSAAGVLDTVLGQQALELAARISSPMSTGASVASLSKELRVVMVEATAGAQAVGDPLDELRARRDAKRNAG